MKVVYQGVVRRGIYFNLYKSGRRIHLLPGHSVELTDAEVAHANTDGGRRFYKTLRRTGLILEQSETEEVVTPEQPNDVVASPVDDKVDLSGGSDSEGSADSDEVILPPESTASLEDEEITPESLVNKLDSTLSEDEVNAMLDELGLSTKKRSKRSKLDDVVPNNMDAIVAYINK